MGSTKQQGSSPNMPIYVYLWTNLSFPRCSLGDSEYTVKYCPDQDKFVINIVKPWTVEVLRIAYNMNDKEVLNKAECKILVKSPSDEVVKDHALVDSHDGVLALVPKEPGPYSICVKCAGQGLLSSLGGGRTE
eukprot:g32607.t1